MSLRLPLPVIRPLLFQNSPYKAIIPDRMAWTASSIKTFRKCKRKFFWKYMMRLRPRAGDKNLIIGSAFHHVLGEWYRGRRSRIGPITKRYLAPLQHAVTESSAYYDEQDLEKFNVMVNTFTGMMMGYEAQYENDKATWTIIRESIEKKFFVNMGDFDYTGKIDLIANDGRMGNFLVEHKTASSISDSYVDRLPMDTQVRGYLYGATNDPSLKLQSGVSAVAYDVVKKCKLRRKSNETIDGFNQRVAEAYTNSPEDYFYREILQFKKEGLELFEHEVRQTHKEYQAIVAPLKDVKDKDVVSWELFQACTSDDPRAWTPNDDSCNDYFRLCEFHGLCLKGMDKMAGIEFDQGEEMHQELQDES